MGLGLESLIEEWDGLGVVTSHHRETGSWIFIALHDTTLGRPTGGCRLKTYGSPAEGLRDAMRLAEGMTFKWAAMDFPLRGRQIRAGGAWAPGGRAAPQPLRAARPPHERAGRRLRRR